MNETPLVSVVVPCFNRAPYLRATLKSILEQSYPSIEAIVVDGGSTDGTLEILRSYGDKIAWISEPDRGHSDAINKGWRMAKGEILAWLNADDLWKAPNGVGLAIDFLRKNPSVDIVYGICESIDDKGNVVGFSHSHPWDLKYSLSTCDHCIPQPAAFMRRSLIEKLGGLDVALLSGKDHDLWLRAALVGRIQYLPEILAQERTTEGTWDRKGDLTADSKVLLTKQFFENHSLPPDITELKNLALSRAHLCGSKYAFKYGRHWGNFLKHLSLAAVYHPDELPTILPMFLKAVYQIESLGWVRSAWRSAKKFRPSR